MSSSKYEKLRKAMFLKYPKGTCQVCELADKDKDLLVAIERLIEEGFGGQSIASALLVMGTEISKYCINRHGQKCMKQKKSSAKSRA